MSAREKYERKQAVLNELFSLCEEGEITKGELCSLAEFAECQNGDYETWYKHAYFGVCPVCGNEDGYLNIGRTHFFHCREHKIAWDIGANLFSSWRDESEEVWKENAKLLEEFITPEEYLEGRRESPILEPETLGEAPAVGHRAVIL